MTRSNKPALTVLMPVYNAAQYLDKAIESILSQTMEDFEFLIIDDGSTDSSLETIERFASDERIRVISRQNKGFVNTLEEGLREAKSDIVVRMDADDISLPKRLEEQYNFLAKNRDYTVVGCQVKTMAEDGTIGKVDPRPTTDQNLKLFLGYGCALSGPTVAFRKEAILSIGGFKESGYPAEDYDCWVRLVESDSAIKIANLPDVLYLYRENTQGISLTNKVKQIKKTIEIGDAYRKAYLEKKLPFLTPFIHKGWFEDIEHINDADAKEELRRIYYTVQTWFRNDIQRRDVIRAYLLKRKLVKYTKRYNPGNLPYIYNQLNSHTFPKGEHEQ